MIAAAQSGTALACQIPCVVTWTPPSATSRSPLSLLTITQPLYVPVSCRHDVLLGVCGGRCVSRALLSVLFWCSCCVVAVVATDVASLVSLAAFAGEL